MNLKAIVAVTGKPGLFKLIGQNKSGLILESLDGNKTKSVINLSTSKISTLEDITVFGNEDDLKLTDILKQIKIKGTTPDPKSGGNALREFFREVAPDHDEDRVYVSDIKKIINWYTIISEHAIFNEEPAEDTQE